ncbi:hypothetical protein [Egicoccus sp. AB-alg2]
MARIGNFTIVCPACKGTGRSPQKGTGFKPPCHRCGGKGKIVKG